MPAIAKPIAITPMPVIKVRRFSQMAPITPNASNPATIPKNGPRLSDVHSPASSIPRTMIETINTRFCPERRASSATATVADGHFVLIPAHAIVRVEVMSTEAMIARFDSRSASRLAEELEKAAEELEA